eukprot:gb/GFBE01067728.1/.p1 GENE.gb/GFBE01067728.1/~~gb/GFBE01067728.1/.p1  ORF type:complete len:200 (+),score=35.61 gb/GFBE01067728.1/:1-600(+)
MGRSSLVLPLLLSLSISSSFGDVSADCQDGKCPAQAAALLQAHAASKARKSEMKDAGYTVTVQSSDFTTEQVEGFLANFTLRSKYASPEEYVSTVFDSDACIISTGVPAEDFPDGSSGDVTICGFVNLVDTVAQYSRKDVDKISGPVEVNGDSVTFHECQTGPDLVMTSDTATFTLHDFGGHLKLMHATYKDFKEVKAC